MKEALYPAVKEASEKKRRSSKIVTVLLLASSLMVVDGGSIQRVEGKEKKQKPRASKSVRVSPVTEDFTVTTPNMYEKLCDGEKPIVLLHKNNKGEFSGFEAICPPKPERGSL